MNAVLILLPLGTWLASEPPADGPREGREVILGGGCGEALPPHVPSLGKDASQGLTREAQPNTCIHLLLFLISKHIVT